MSIADIARVLNKTLDQVPDDALIEALAALDAAIEQIAPIAAGSDELGQVCQQWQHASAVLIAVRQQCHYAGELIEQYMTNIGAARHVSAPVPAARPEQAADTPGVTNSHGDRYPVEGAGTVEQLPRRVTPNSGQRTVGVGRLGERVLPPLESGQDPVWTPAVRRRLTSLGVPPDRLDSHVELRFAEMMIETRRNHAELAINYTPCGVEMRKRALDTCDKVLPAYLPEGFTLTVYGTTQENRPYRRTYEGRA